MILCKRKSHNTKPFIGHFFSISIFYFRIKMRLSVIEASDRLVDLINPDKPEVFEIEDPLMGPKVIYIFRLNFQFDSDRHFSIKTKPKNKCSKSIRFFLLISYGGYISSFSILYIDKDKKALLRWFQEWKTTGDQETDNPSLLMLYSGLS